MNEQNLTKHPIWKAVAEEMISSGIDYGQSWRVEFFEEKLRCKRDQERFRWEMLNLRQHIETEIGLYISSSDNGKTFSVPHAFGHEDVASKFDHKVRRYAVRGVNIRSATLMNPKAKLSTNERQLMERRLEIASTRLVLLSRSASFASMAAKHAPKLLEKKGIP